MNNTAFVADSNPETTVNLTVPRFETIKTTAKIVGLPEHLIRQKVLSGEIVAINAGRRYLVNVDKFIDYLNSHKLPAPNNQDETAEHTGIKPIPLNL